jgi:4'-phosphopantetheinyl transferase
VESALLRAALGARTGPLALLKLSAPFDVTYVALDVDDAVVGEGAATLSPDESVRARGLGDIQRRRFIVGRAGLRRALGAFVGRDPASLRFEYGPHGKPELLRGNAWGDVRFNLAHSRDLAVVAITHESRIGVDVESTSRVTRMTRVAERYFTPSEREQLALLPEDEQRIAFFRVWTRKEAYLKARGEGISQILRVAEVTIDPGNPRLVRLGVPEGEPDRWLLADLAAPEGFIGAVAVERDR